MNRVSVVGLGRLGLPLAAVFASKGFRVVGVDIDLKKLDAIRNGWLDTCEPGLKELLKENRARLSLTADLGMAVDVTNVTVIIVATPSDADGCFSLEYVLPACRDIGSALKSKTDYHLVVVGSTVNPGDCEGPILRAIEEASGKKVGVDFGLCCIPEFVALGEIVEGYLNPDFVLIGASDVKASLKASAVYGLLCGTGVPIARTNLVNAELAKIAANCHTVIKTVFANQMAELCESIPGADVDVVTSTIGLDSRASPEYLTGSTTAAGPCFGRDMVALPSIAKRYGVELPLIETAGELNLWQVERLANILTEPWRRIGAKTLGVLGLAYKPGVDVREPSAGLMLVEKLGDFFEIVAFDPMIQIGRSVRTAQICADLADVVVITTPWPEFKDVKFRKGQVVIDCWRMLDTKKIEAEYVAIGRGKQHD